MIYEFFCSKCNAIDEVIRAVVDVDEPVVCTECDSRMTRHYTAPAVVTKGESIPYYHPALGQIVKSDSDAQAIAKRNGLVEVGNENMQKYTQAPVREAYE
jgi:putative FmdB family regulatory protein